MILSGKHPVVQCERKGGTKSFNSCHDRLQHDLPPRAYARGAVHLHSRSVRTLRNSLKTSKNIRFLARRSVGVIIYKNFTKNMTKSRVFTFIKVIKHAVSFNLVHRSSM